jgi:Asp-tRNAAsn/Glu-tRNAGln amidotransferase A subunit and related amidases
LIRRDFDRAFEAVDVLLTPTSPTTAFGFGAHSDDPLAMYLADLLTIPANMAGLPAINVPCGFDLEGLPIGLQLITGVLRRAAPASGGSPIRTGCPGDAGSTCGPIGALGAGPRSSGFALVWGANDTGSCVVA